MTSPTPAEFLDELLDILGPNGEHWIKDDAFRDDRTNMCLLGGLEEARNHVAEVHYSAGGGQNLGVMLAGICNNLIDDLCTTAQEMFPDRVDPSTTCSAIDFNDHDDTDFTDVRALIEKTRAKVAEQVT